MAQSLYLMTAVNVQRPTAVFVPSDCLIVACQVWIFPPIRSGTASTVTVPCLTAFKMIDL